MQGIFLKTLIPLILNSVSNLKSIKAPPASVFKYLICIISFASFRIITGLDLKQQLLLCMAVNQKYTVKI